MKTLKAIAENYTPETYPIMVGNFLDYVYATTADNRYNAICDEPRYSATLSQHVLPHLAAIADSIAFKYDIALDCMCYNQSKYFLREPHFPKEARGVLQLILFLESPIEFRARNIFVSSHILERV